MATLEDLLYIRGFVLPDLYKVVEEWIMWVSNKSSSSKLTTIAYVSDLKFFLTFLGKHLNVDAIGFDDIKDICNADLRAWLSDNRSNGICARSNARKLSAIKNFLIFISKRDGVPIKCINTIRRPKLSKLLPHPVNSNVVSTMLSIKKFADVDLNWVTLRDKALYIILYGAGLRISEALNLRISDIGQNIRIFGKGGKERLVPVLDEMLFILDAYMNECPYINRADSNCYIFWGVRGKVLNKSVVESRMKAFREKHNFPEYLTPHALRHSFASHLVREGVELRYIQELLGHSSLAATEIYTEINDKTVIETYKNTHPINNIF